MLLRENLRIVKPYLTAREVALAILKLPYKQQFLPFAAEDDGRYFRFTNPPVFVERDICANHYEPSVMHPEEKPSVHVLTLNQES